MIKRYRVNDYEVIVNKYNVSNAIFVNCWCIHVTNNYYAIPFGRSYVLITMEDPTEPIVDYELSDDDFRYIIDECMKNLKQIKFTQELARLLQS